VKFFPVQLITGSNSFAEEDKMAMFDGKKVLVFCLEIFYDYEVLLWVRHTFFYFFLYNERYYIYLYIILPYLVIHNERYKF